MKIVKRTPRTRLAQRAIGTKALGITKQLSEELGFIEEHIAEELAGLAVLSTGLSFDTGEIDFDLLQPTDTPEEMAQKFVAYIDTKCTGTIDQAWELIAGYEAPAESILAPVGPKDDGGADPKSKS